MTRDGIIDMVSLRTIEDYLRGSDRVVMLGTENDVILAPARSSGSRTCSASGRGSS